MMKKITTLLIGLLIITSSFVSTAQELTPTQKREMNAKLLTLIDSYEKYGTFAESYMADGYLYLFKDTNCKVFCDFVSNTNYGKNISVRDYVEFAKNNVSEVQNCILKKVKKSEYEFIDGSWKVDVSFVKELFYVDVLQKFFSGEYETVLHISYDPQLEYFCIESVTGKDVSPYIFPGGKFNIIEKTSVKDEELRCSGEHLEFNDFNVAYSKTSDFSIDDDDLIVTPKHEPTPYRYDVYTFAYRPIRTRLKIRGAMSLGSAYDVSSSVNFGSVRSSAYEFGADFGYMWNIGGSGKSKMGIYGGLGLSMSSVAFSIENQTYSLSDSKVNSDDTFTKFTRKFNIADASEKLDFTDVVVPVYGSYECKLGKRVTLALDAGVKLYLSTKLKVTPYAVNGTVSIIESGASTITEPLSIENKFLSPVSYKRKNYDLVGFARIGLDVSVLKRMALYLRFGYDMGFQNVYESQQNDWLSDDLTSVPVIYANGKYVPVRSFADCISYRRKAFVGEFGLKFKF